MLCFTHVLKLHNLSCRCQENLIAVEHGLAEGGSLDPVDQDLAEMSDVLNHLQWSLRTLGPDLGDYQDNLDHYVHRLEELKCIRSQLHDQDQEPLPVNRTHPEDDSSASIGSPSTVAVASMLHPDPVGSSAVHDVTITQHRPTPPGRDLTQEELMSPVAVSTLKKEPSELHSPLNPVVMPAPKETYSAPQEAAAAGEPSSDGTSHGVPIHSAGSVKLPPGFDNQVPRRPPPGFHQLQVYQPVMFAFSMFSADNGGGPSSSPSSVVEGADGEPEGGSSAPLVITSVGEEAPSEQQEVILVTSVGVQELHLPQGGTSLGDQQTNLTCTAPASPVDVRGEWEREDVSSPDPLVVTRREGGPSELHKLIYMTSPGGKQHHETLDDQQTFPLRSCDMHFTAAATGSITDELTHQQKVSKCSFESSKKILDHHQLHFAMPAALSSSSTGKRLDRIQVQNYNLSSSAESAPPSSVVEGAVREPESSSSVALVSTSATEDRSYELRNLHQPSLAITLDDQWTVTSKSGDAPVTAETHSIHEEPAQQRKEEEDHTLWRFPWSTKWLLNHLSLVLMLCTEMLRPVLLDGADKVTRCHLLHPFDPGGTFPGSATRCVKTQEDF